MINKYTKIKYLSGVLSDERRYQLLIIFILSILSLILEIISIGLVVPFLSFILVPEKILEKIELYIVLDINISENLELITVVFAITFIIVSILSSTLRYFLMAKQTNTSFAIGSDLATRIYEVQLNKDYIYHTNLNSSQMVATILTKTQDVVNQVINPIIVLASSTFLLLGILAFLVVLQPFVAITMFVTLLLTYLAISVRVRSKLQKSGIAVSELRTKTTQNIIEGFKGIRDIILTHSAKKNVDKFSILDSNMRSSSAEIVRLSQAPRYFVEAAAIGAMIACAIYLSTMQDEVLIIPQIASFALALQKMLPLVQHCYQSVSNLQGGEAILDDVIGACDVTEKSESTRYNVGRYQTIDFQTQLKLVDLTFKYATSSRLIFENVNLDLESGEHLAIIGGSGAGKSTLIDCITGLLPSTSGKILIDGVELSRHNVRSWQNLIAYVPQTIFFVDDTVARNVSLFSEDHEVDLDLITKILDIVCFNLGTGAENRSDIRVGENGELLSGGQRQRLAIARALYANPKLLILDESTSGLDQKTEALIMQNLIRSYPDLTIISVTHKDSIIEYADKVLMLS